MLLKPISRNTTQNSYEGYGKIRNALVWDEKRTTGSDEFELCLMLFIFQEFCHAANPAPDLAAREFQVDALRWTCGTANFSRSIP
jgi:hypothetical protein